MSEIQSQLFGLPSTKTVRTSDGRRHEESQPHNNTPTSQAAAKSISPVAGTLEAQALAYIRDRGAFGATNFEIAKGTGMLIQTVCGRVNKLASPNKQLIKDSGKTRPSPSGRQSRVWVCSKVQTEG